MFKPVLTATVILECDFTDDSDVWTALLENLERCIERLHADGSLTAGTDVKLLHALVLYGDAEYNEYKPAAEHVDDIRRTLRRNGHNVRPMSDDDVLATATTIGLVTPEGLLRPEKAPELL